MKKFFGLIVALAVLLSDATVFAAEQLIEASGEYIMDTRLDETFASATARAREEAKRAAVEKAGTYIKTYAKTIDFELVEDEVEAVAASLLKIQSESSKTEPAGDNLLKFTVTIKALVNELSDADLKAFMNDRNALQEAARQYKDLQKEYAALKAQMDELRRNYDKANETQRADIKKQVARNSKNFFALEATARGNEFYFAKNYAQALAAYDEAVTLNPNYADAYNNRGVVKYELGQFAEAISNYTMAIKLKPNFVDALNNRGNAYAALGQFQNAAQDLQTAVKLNDKNAVGHNNLGNVYYSLRNFDAAIQEYTRAIQLNPNYAEAYYNRGAVYYGKKNYAAALDDIKMSMSLNLTDNATQELYGKILRAVT